MKLPPSEANSLIHEACVWRVSNREAEAPRISSRSRPSPTVRRLTHHGVKLEEELKRTPETDWSLRSSLAGPASKCVRPYEVKASSSRTSPCHRRCEARRFAKPFW